MSRRRAAALALAGLMEMAGAARGAGGLPPPEAASVVLDRWGHPLRTFLSDEELFCRPVRLDAVSPWTILATLAVEDRRFFTHGGVDFRSVARALVQDVRAGRAVAGGSTITQQLARALEPRPRTLRGKVEEACRAWRLERRNTKAGILEAYLNRAPYGHRCRGIEAAALTYFGTPGRDLSLGQAALLAGVLKSPSRFDPLRFPARAARRQRVVLAELADLGWIDRTDRRRALAEPTGLRDEPRAFAAPHFAGFARRRAPDRGLIRTSLDGPVQERLEAVLRGHLAVLRDHNVTNGALVALDNRTGEVLAWVGSADFWDARHQGQVDGVTAPRQPGSALKPFVYGLAFARGMAASDVIMDAPLFLPNGHTPKNYDEEFHGPVRAREALACSYNIPAVRLAQRFGSAAVWEKLHDFGFASLSRPPVHYGLGLALGAGEVTLLELANAYATLGREGRWMPVRLFAEGEGPALGGGPERRALDPESAYVVLSVLSDNVARAEAFGLNSPLHLPFPFAAKTGTTKDYRDNWAAGCTPDWTVAVWVGNFDGKAMHQVSGITGAAPILRDAALAMADRFGSRAFPVPEGVRQVAVCPKSGDLPGPGCAATMVEVFPADRVPGRVCRLHREAREPAAREAADGATTIEFPRQGDIFRVDPSAPSAAQAIRLLAAPAARRAIYRWRVDERPLADTTAEVFWPLVPGWHTVDLDVDGVGGTAQARGIRFLVSP